MASVAVYFLLEAVVGGAITFVLLVHFTSPLRHIPGPFLTKYTDLWRLLSVLGRKPEQTQRKLHDELGSVVRLGPNMVSISDPAMIAEVYSRQNILTKGDFYKVMDLNVNGQRWQYPFTMRSETANTAALKPITRMFSMGSMMQWEPLINSTIEKWLEHLTARFASPGRVCDIDNWVSYCTWDMIGDLTFSERFGFMERGGDVLDMLHISRRSLDYVSVIGMMPWLDHLLERNPIRRFGPPTFTPIVGYIMDRIAQRKAGEDAHNAALPDMLDGFLDEQKRDPDYVHDYAILGYVFANLMAGADTVAIELRSILYYLCKHPQYKAKLQQELDAARITAPASWADCQELPYLSAVISEGCRLAPGVSLPLERKVGPRGLVVASNKVFIPPDTTVGINPYVVNRDRDVYGADAEYFRPARWLRADGEAEAAFQARSSRMRGTDMTFGAGKRMCFGRNLALIEMNKITASLFATFDVQLIDSNKKWVTSNHWILHQSNIDVRFTKRR